MENTAALSRLRWQCRRGMLELDVLLGNFLEKVFLNLSLDDQVVFEKLLTCSDQDLYLWLTGKATVSDPMLSMMVEKIREHARNTSSSNSF